MRFSSYIICGAPRSGSTFLCDILASTGVAGKPHSYYRDEDASGWATLWEVPEPHRLDTAEFERAYLSAMVREGTAETGIFGLRIMWSSVADASRRLDAVEGAYADVAARFAQAFGATLYIHLSRQDKLAQAISLIRAEQSGLWHRAADGRSARERPRIGRRSTMPPASPKSWTNCKATMLPGRTSFRRAESALFD